MKDAEQAMRAASNKLEESAGKESPAESNKLLAEFNRTVDYYLRLAAHSDVSE